MSWESQIIPGHSEAVKSERLDRCFAFLPLPEKIAGIECEPLTLLRLTWLEAASNPFIVGGQVTTAAVIQFIWIVNKCFTTDVAQRDKFIASNLHVNYDQAVRDIDEYIDRAFLDAPQGVEGTSYYASAAGLVVAMCKEPFRWSYEQVINGHLRILFQLLKAEARCRGDVVVNKRSQKIECDWLDTIKPPSNVIQMEGKEI